MLFRSWKDDLLRMAERLKKRTKQKRWLESSSARFEKEIFISFYGVRKLLEADKFSGDIVKYKFSLKAYPSRSKNVTKLNWYKIDKHYNLENPKVITKDVRWLANQIIHSYVFIPLFNDDFKNVHAILFASDREKNTRLFQLEIVDIIDFLKKAGNDYPDDETYIFNEKKKDYKYSGKMQNK